MISCTHHNIRYKESESSYNGEYEGQYYTETYICQECKEEIKKIYVASHWENEGGDRITVG
jgi:hypothetical protein